MNNSYKPYGHPRIIVKGKLLLFLVVLIAFSACGENDCGDCVNASCHPGANTVKKATDQPGLVSYDTENERWLLTASQAGTYDSQDIGIICGELPENFRQDGISVLFSGEYKAFDGDSRGPFPGQMYYYLFVSAIALRPASAPQ